jgi:hypothetical protein
VAAIGARKIWCCTCGEYVRTGTHGIHVPSYGHGPRVESERPPERIGSTAAIVLVIAAVTLVPFVLCALVYWATR